VTALEQRMIDVDGAAPEVLLGGTGAPVICQGHPMGAMDPEYRRSGGWEGDMGRLVVVNPRGLGRSSGHTPRDFTLRRCVDDLEAVRRRLGVDRWVFWGSSAGAAVGLLYALAHPAALSGPIVARAGPSGPRIRADERSVVSPRHPDYRRDLAALPGRERRPALLRSLRPELASAEWVRLREDLWVLVRGPAPG
jgi:pimeloyl-ACP methyl ester carboxylesterase